MSVKDPQIRQVIFEYINQQSQKRGQSPQVIYHHRYNEGINDLCKARIPGFDKDDEQRLYELFYELSLERIVVPDFLNSQPYQWPYYRLTTHGAKVLSDPADLTYDPNGFVEQLRRRSPDVSDTVVFYVRQALACFNYRLLPAAAVMLGCAAEKLILDLIEAFMNALSNPTEKSNMQKELDKAPHISQKYGVLWKRLEPKRNQLPFELAENLEERLTSTYYQVKKVRNASGHPTGHEPDVGEVHGNLILFGGYSELVHGIIRHLADNQLT